MTSVEAFESFAVSLIGLPISHIWRGYGSAVFIEFGKLQPVAKRDGWPGNPEGQVSLSVEWSWRIEDQTAIRCGSWSEEDLWRPAFDALCGTQVARCELFGALPEIAVTTVGDIRFLTFSTTEGQPQWHLVDRRNGIRRWFSVRDGKVYFEDGSEPAS